MSKPENNSEKQDRKERYERRRTHGSLDSMNDSSRPRRAEPYKRKHFNPEQWDDEDEWFDDDN